MGTEWMYGAFGAAAGTVAGGIIYGGAGRLLARRGLSFVERTRERRAARALLALWYGWLGLYCAPSGFEWAAGALLGAVLLAATVTDLQAMIIPDDLAFPALAAAVALRLVWHPLPLWNYALAAVGAFAVLYAMALLSRGGLGGGDIKLYLFIGAVCGVTGTLLSLLFASMLGAFVGLAMRGLGALRRGEHVPFAPFIMTGSFVAFAATVYLH